ncbi:hypothetical protein MJO29_012672 [Puccinia striiformis f. sp. tritici]|uniref:hypothetical protein n=1 Tax=Puccinia striiformis f. sp. tritici TaxID=168172 RepID=UPI002008649E|nr:hypothetical protein Pst134EA_024134 [Puccinia striiformis f. sp. tritici]KAH9453249.1 hypothetical protein Pst134EA_024134 [Puccinia striiformis f. sp. tritici]KAI7942828.1 hypothetical protein MJO29_012672 [Puccinia striiformis f. sp. tritici]
MEGFYETDQKTIYRFKVPVQAQPEGYPSSLNPHISHHISVPIGEKFESRRIINSPSNGCSVDLKVSIKLGRKALSPEAFLDSSLFAELIDLLNLLAIDDETISISRITEIKIVPDTPRAHLCVRLELLPMDKDLESSLQTRQSMSRLRSIDLELKYTQSKVKKDSTTTSSSKDTPMDFQSLIHVHPLVLPLKSSLKMFMKRFVKHNLLLQLPLVFNSRWQESLEDSVPFQKTIAETISWFSNSCISDEIRVELRNMSQFEDCRSKNHGRDGMKEEEEIWEEEITSKLLDHQIDIGQLPNTTIARSRRSRSLSGPPSSLDLDVSMSSDPEGMLGDQQTEDDLWVDDDDDGMSQTLLVDNQDDDLSLYTSGGSLEDLDMHSP